MRMGVPFAEKLHPWPLFSGYVRIKMFAMSLLIVSSPKFLLLWQCIRSYIPHALPHVGCMHSGLHDTKELF